MMMNFVTTVLLASTFISTFASDHNYKNIHVPGFGQLQHIGQHVEIPHPPENLIHVTKTVAIRVPVPYEVKVPYKVPYPVHVNKLYPVEVPKIVHIQSHAAPTSHSSSPSVEHQNQYEVNQGLYTTGDHGFGSDSYQSDHQQSYENVDKSFNNNNYGQQNENAQSYHDYDFGSAPQSQSIGENLHY